MPKGFHGMDPSSGQALAEVLLNLITMLTHGANSIGRAPSLPKMKALDVDVRVTLAILRRHINPLQSPLYRLPPDLFPEIASHLASETDLVNATHVSHHLRNTLLSHPSLWSHLNFERETRARAFFERSGRTPLHVDMVKNTAKFASSLTELRQQSDRIAWLKLHLWAVQKEFLSESLPSLRRLEIVGDCWYCWEGMQWDAIRTPAGRPIEKTTSWSLPSLTSLVVYNLSSIQVSAPNLTCFKFRPEESQINVDELLGFLSGCPLLEHIDISYTHELPRDNPDPAVSLPGLRTYTQTALEGGCSPTILNALSLPPFCSITFRSPAYGRTTTEIGDILPHFENRDYLAEIKRIKLRTTVDPDGSEVAGTLELINARGTRVCAERMFDVEEGGNGAVVRGGKDHNAAHLNLLRSLNCRLAETLCIEGRGLHGATGVGVEFMLEALGSGSVRTLILCRSVVWQCLLALDWDPDASGHSQWFLLIHTIIIGQDPERYYPGYEVLMPLLGIAQKRKAAGFPLGSISLFFRNALPPGWPQVLEDLRACVGELEVVTGDDALDWNVDKYFLDGLDHLRGNRGVQWD